MAKTRKKARASGGFRSIAEFEEKFFPKAAEERRLKARASNARDAGVDLADEVLDRIQRNRTGPSN